MVSATTRAEASHSPASLIPGSSSSISSKNSFSQQLSTELKGYLNQSGSWTPGDINVNEVAGRNSGGSQFLAGVIPGTAGTAKTAGDSRSAMSSAETAKETHTSSPTTAAPATASGTHTSSPTTQAATAPSDVPTMLGMGPVAGTAPVQQVTSPAPVTTAPVSEADAYWDAQPAPVQALRNMPDGTAKDQLALKLANEGYSIDTQIMVWGWDPQMTMTVRENQGYSWVPGYGQSNIPVGPGLSMPDDPSTYNPGNPPAGSIQVSTAFAVGTIQNPLVQTDSSNS
jgi:hypothetical protein